MMRALIRTPYKYVSYVLFNVFFTDENDDFKMQLYTMTMQLQYMSQQRVTCCKICPGEARDADGILDSRKTALECSFV